MGTRKHLGHSWIQRIMPSRLTDLKWTVLSTTGSGRPSPRVLFACFDCVTQGSKMAQNECLPYNVLFGCFDCVTQGWKLAHNDCLPYFPSPSLFPNLFLSTQYYQDEIDSLSPELWDGVGAAGDLCPEGGVRLRWTQELSVDRELTRRQTGPFGERRQSACRFEGIETMCWIPELTGKLKQMPDLSRMKGKKVSCG